jgi:hypothetical protein
MQPTDPNLEAQIQAWRAENVRPPRRPWLRFTIVAVKLAVLAYLLMATIGLWAALPATLAYSGAIPLAVVTVALPLWIWYVVWSELKR